MIVSEMFPKLPRQVSPSETQDLVNRFSSTNQKF